MNTETTLRKVVSVTLGIPLLHTQSEKSDWRGRRERLPVNFLKESFADEDMPRPIPAKVTLFLESDYF